MDSNALIAQIINEESDRADLGLTAEHTDHGVSVFVTDREMLPLGGGLVLHAEVSRSFHRWGDYDTVEELLYNTVMYSNRDVMAELEKSRETVKTRKEKRWAELKLEYADKIKSTVLDRVRVWQG